MKDIKTKIIDNLEQIATAPSALLLKLLKEILLIAIRICYYITLCYLVYKHSCLLTYCSLIYIRIISRDRLLGFNSIKGNITNSNSNIKI
ncbi:hypothetical protein HBI34_116740 [Parastagonospora nodorum]|nr:hypothetical protein HBI34_116740 [Parastagonospora nodorum]